MPSTTVKYWIKLHWDVWFSMSISTYVPNTEKKNISGTLLQYFILSDVVVSLCTALPLMNHIMRQQFSSFSVDLGLVLFFCFVFSCCFWLWCRGFFFVWQINFNFSNFCLNPHVWETCLGFAQLEQSWWRISQVCLEVPPSKQKMKNGLLTNCGKGFPFLSL